ncbi:MAG: glycosyltransferase family 39 protein [Elusimicrobia bacterium]|nr:glycosyltransferase family 39 protein [Elusimicrobiota bacterium]
MKRTLVVASACLGLFLAWEAWSLAGFVSAETRPPSWDEANHLDVALAYRKAAGQGRWGDIWGFVPKPDIPPFPPLHHLALAAFLGGKDPAWSALWANWFYLALLSVSVFGMAWELRKDAAALAAPLLIAGAPAVQSLLHAQLPDLALTAWAAAGFWALLKADGFADLKWSLVFGAVFGVGMLHKWSYFSYFWPALYLAFKALKRPEARRNVLWAAGLALGLSVPWYAVRFPLVLSRLVAASTDFCVPFWRGGAFFQYLLELPSSLGPLFVVLGLIGAARPKLLRDVPASRLVLAGLVTSYVFWAVVPNRQMRYLLPGLPGLAVLCAAAWDRRLVWVVAGVQLLGAVNYTTGWLPSFTIPARVTSISFFPSGPARSEQWRIEDILAEVKKRWKGPGTAAVALLANDSRFNELNFTWTLHRLGWSGIRMTGPGAGFWELSPFVLLKKGFLGPASVTAGYHEAAADFSAGAGWAAQAFSEARRWQLPDGSIAVLFERAKPLRWCDAGSLVMDVGFASGKVGAGRLLLKLEGWKAKEAVYKRVAVEPERLCWRGVCAARARVELLDAGIVSASSLPAHACGMPAKLVRLGKAKVVSAAVTAENLTAFFESRGMRVQSLELDGTVRLRGKYRGVPVELEAALAGSRARSSGGDASFRVELSRLRVAGLPLPAERVFRYLLNGPALELDCRPHETVVSTALRPGGAKVLPFALDVPGVTVRRGRITVP